MAVRDGGAGRRPAPPPFFLEPLPNIYVGDAGTKMYARAGDLYVERSEWERTFQDDWKGESAEHIAHALEGIGELRLQGPENQSAYKVSYYVPAQAVEQMVARVRERLSLLNI